MSSPIEALLTSKLVAAEVEISLERAEWRRLERLVDLWLRYGRVMNLTAAKSPEELVPHVLEAILAVKLARDLGASSGTRWLDVGSGAGFPALVIAALTDVELTLVEPRERRASFLEVALAQLQREARVLPGACRCRCVEAAGSFRGGCARGWKLQCGECASGVRARSVVEDRLELGMSTWVGICTSHEGKRGPILGK